MDTTGIFLLAQGHVLLAQDETKKATRLGRDRNENIGCHATAN
jgi:hypothetical protein